MYVINQIVSLCIHDLMDVIPFGIISSPVWASFRGWGSFRVQLGIISGAGSFRVQLGIISGAGSFWVQLGIISGVGSFRVQLGIISGAGSFQVQLGIISGPVISPSCSWWGHALVLSQLFVCLHYLYFPQTANTIQGDI